jgi:hypothetical protein
MGSYSVHTNAQALALGEAGIRNRAQLLRQQGMSTFDGDANQIGNKSNTC